ncbi:IclR family transcriptional regulator [Pseudosporangium ferrugineum]|uniref:IclR family transcriptional regulator n=1 Tax=Pseudosporangium ferrugineum TaxID=439699 RepID=A0A2T0RXC4_9ACTN|nr:helix-turn-helix domain-containing protein [Pseudosporangium ferrugineum]PRY25834.1 IclR family transcriptional regulator [Pseudosporangium ferrugineum]
MANTDPSDASTSDIQAVARVGQICALFGPRVPELSAADVAERTGLNRTTAYRYCASMVAARILERGSRRGTFALGPLMLELGTLALGRQRVVDLARPHLRKLSAAVRMTSVLSVLGAQGPVVALAQEDTSRMLVVTVHPGTKLDVTAAQTRLFLAHSANAALDAMLEELPPVERARLEAEVDAARRRGFSFVRPSGGPFVVAAPVFDEGGLAATVAILGAGELPDLTPVLDQLLAATTALSDELGAPPGAPALQ